jgi:hypothetical protein
MKNSSPLCRLGVDLLPLAAHTAARKPPFGVRPDAAGLFDEAPQRHKAIVSFSTENSPPSASTTRKVRPVTRKGPFSYVEIVVLCSIFTPFPYPGRAGRARRVKLVASATTSLA